MKRFHLILIFVLIFSSCRTARHTPPATRNTRTGYISTYSEVAIREMKRAGIPASIKMAQAILESGDGNSTLARNGNNHFGIKCHDWKGRKIYHDDDMRNECFRRYNNPEESFFDHSDFLTGRPRYAGLFQLDPHDYKGWAKGLKAAGYATDPNYDRLLIRIIEENQLYRLDKGQIIRAEAPPVLTAGTSGSYAAAGPSPPAATTGKRDVLSRNRIRYIVALDGDNYESLTREKGLMQWEISRYNELPAPRINPGDIIYLQPKRNRAERGNETHIVKPGETMHNLSQLYGVKLDRLLRMNFLERGQEPEPGFIIYLRRQNPGSGKDTRIRPEYDL